MFLRSLLTAYLHFWLASGAHITHKNAKKKIYFLHSKCTFGSELKIFLFLHPKECGKFPLLNCQGLALGHEKRIEKFHLLELKFNEPIQCFSIYVGSFQKHFLEILPNKHIMKQSKTLKYLKYFNVYDCLIRWWHKDQLGRVYMKFFFSQKLENSASI